MTFPLGGVLTAYPHDSYPESAFSRKPQDVVNLFMDRRRQRGPVLAQMQDIRDQVNGDVIVPLPELDKDERSFVANLVQQGLDNYGMRIASVMPNLTAPSADPRRPKARERADIRRRANLSWWESNGINRQMRRRARWLVGYATAPTTLRPDFRREIPRWDLRNPLNAFPAPVPNPDDLCPDDAIFAVQRTLGWLRSRYPEKAYALANDRCHPDTLFTVLEYDDAEQIACIAIGQIGGMPGHLPLGGGLNRAVVLDQVPNRAGIPLTVVPGRITLDRQAGQFDGMLGMYQMQAKLMALEVIAVQKAVFPDTYLVSRPNEQAKFVSGPHPGSSGLINEIEGGDIKEVSVNPGFMTPQTIDRLERAQKQNGGIPAEFSGESGSNIRTGRRGDAVMSAVVDFPVQEAQETLAASLEEENRRATKIAKAYFGNTPKSFHVSWKGAKGHVTYTPNKDFDSEYTQVTYAAPGSDINNLSIAVGQRVGMGTMSKATAMKIDPMVDDAELEADLIVSEGLEMAMLQGLQQQAAQGSLPPNDLARIMQLVAEENVPLSSAILKAQKEAQERQATQDAAGQDAAVAPGAPEAQPGLALPGAGAEAGAAAIAPPPTSLGNLDQLLMQMRGTSAGAA